MRNFFLAFFSSDDMGANWLKSRIESFQINWVKCNSWLFRALVAVLFVGIVIYVAAAIKLMPFPHIFKGWTGGTIIHNAWTLSKGENFYVDPLQEPPVAASYTPGFQILAAPLVFFFGPQTWVGRIVAISGLIMIWVLVYLVAKNHTASRLYGLIAVGLLMATYGVMDSHFDSIHPDSWSIAWGLLSLVVAEASIRNRSRLIALAALFAAFSYFTKQTGISFAMGAILYLALHRPLLALAYAAILGALLTTGYLVGQHLTGGMFWDYTIGAVTGQPILWLMIPLCLKFIVSSFIFGIIVFSFILFDRPSSLSLTSPYAMALPIMFAVYMYGSIREGGNVSSNFFPLLVLGSIIFVSGLACIRTALSKNSPKLAFLLLSLILAQNVMTLSKLPEVPTVNHYATAAQIDKIVRETPGEVLVFYRISFAYLNGRKVYDNLGIMHDRTNWTDYSRLENQIRTRYFTRILIPKIAFDLWMIRQPLYKILMENYEQEMIIGHLRWHQTTPMIIFHRK